MIVDAGHYVTSTCTGTLRVLSRDAAVSTVRRSTASRFRRQSSLRHEKQLLDITSFSGCC